MSNISSPPLQQQQHLMCDGTTGSVVRLIRLTFTPTTRIISLGRSEEEEEEETMDSTTTTTTGDSGGSSISDDDDNDDTDDDTAVHETHRDDHSRINRNNNNHLLLYRNDGHCRNTLPPLPSYSMGRPTHSFHSMVMAVQFVRTTNLDHHSTKNHSSPKSFDSNHTRRPRHCRTTLDAKASTHRYSSRRTVVSHPQKRRYLHVMESTMTILHYYCCCRQLPFIVMILLLLLFQQQQQHHPYHSPSCFCSSFITTTTTIPTRRRTQQPQQCHPWQQQYSSSSVSSFQRPTRRRHCDIWKIRATPNDEEEKEQDAASPLFSTEYIYTQRLQHQIDQLRQKDRSSTPIAVAVCFAC